MPMVRLRVLPAMPDPVRKRLLYRTRMLMADGDEFELGPSDARMLCKTRWAEEAIPLAKLVPPALRRRGRPPRAAAVEPPPEPEPSGPEPFEDKTVAELREIAEDRGIDLPSGYIRRDELVEKLAETEDDDPEEPRG